MLEARFPRIPGDMGNAQTWPFPVLYRVVPGASPEKVVLQGARGLLPDFLAAAAELVRLGAEAITTNCGFLSLFQREIAAHVSVPVATSSLMQVPWVEATLPPGKRAGLVTVSGSSLTPAHLEAAGVRLDTPMIGTENGREFFRVLIKAENDDMDVELARQDVVEAGRDLDAFLCGGAAGGRRSTGLRHLFDDHLVPRRPTAARLRLNGSKRPPRIPQRKTL